MLQKIYKNWTSDFFWVMFIEVMTFGSGRKVKKTRFPIPIPIPIGMGIGFLSQIQLEI